MDTAREAVLVAHGAQTATGEAAQLSTGEQFGVPESPLHAGVDPIDHARVMKHVESVVKDTIKRIAQVAGTPQPQPVAFMARVG